MFDEKNKFDQLVTDRLNLPKDKREGLRESIRGNQTLQALVCVEKVFEEYEARIKTLEAALEQPKAAEPPKAKTASSRKTTKATDDKEDEKSASE